MTVTSFREIPLWRLEAKPQKIPDFLNDESINDDKNVELTNETQLIESSEMPDKMTKTSSYGAMGNDQLDVPTVHVRQLTYYVLHRR